MSHIWHAHELAKVGIGTIMPQLAQTRMFHIWVNVHFHLSRVARVHFVPQLEQCACIVHIYGPSLAVPLLAHSSS